VLPKQSPANHSASSLIDFLKVTTPVQEPDSTVGQFFSAIAHSGVFGIKFEFTDSETKDFLVYIPQLSIVNLKLQTGRPVLFETSRDSIFNMMTPSETLKTKLAKSELEALNRTPLTEIDPENSFIAVKWNFTMSLKSKIEDKAREARHPSFLVYYGFPTIPGKLRIIGLQASTIGGIQRWTHKDIHGQEWYTTLSKRLNEFIDLSRAKGANSIFRMSRSSFEFMETHIEDEWRLEHPSDLMHQDYVSFVNEFYTD